MQIAYSGEQQRPGDDQSNNGEGEEGETIEEV